MSFHQRLDDVSHEKKIKKSFFYNRLGIAIESLCEVWGEALGEFSLNLPFIFSDHAPFTRRFTKR
jgi:hypothetical protein